MNKCGFLLVLFGFCGLTWASRCGKVYVNRISKAESDLIVNEHNRVRKLIANGKVSGQPRGINLKRLKYDQRLADAAQKIADSCTFAHQTVDDDRFAVGQNLYLLTSTAPNNKSNWTSAVQSWFDEHKYYHYGPCCDNGDFQATGHYTQVVWANTEYVGCGYTYYSTNDYFKYQKLYVCNYGPAGNYIGELPYKTGNSGCENLC